LKIFLLRKIFQLHSNLISIETVDEIGYIVIFYFIHKSWHYLQLDIHLYKGAGCPISPVMFVYVFNNLFTGAPVQGLPAISLWIGIQGNGGTKWQLVRIIPWISKSPNQIASSSYSLVNLFFEEKATWIFFLHNPSPQFIWETSYIAKALVNNDTTFIKLIADKSMFSTRIFPDLLWKSHPSILLTPEITQYCWRRQAFLLHWSYMKQLVQV